MEFLNQVGAYFTPQVAALLITVVLVVLFFAVSKVASTFANTEKGRALLQFWELIDDVIMDAIVTVATTEVERTAAKEAAERYSLELGRPIDWRMAYVLSHVEDYVERFIPIDLDLVKLAAHAERVYFELQDQLNEATRRDGEDPANDETVEVTGL